MANGATIAAQNAMSPRLFKYLHPDSTDVLRNARLRFSSPKVLNDPFELKPHFSAFSSEEWISEEMEIFLRRQAAESYDGLPEPVRRILSPAAYLSIARDRIAPQARKEWGKVAPLLVDAARDVFTKGFEEKVGILCLTEFPTSLLMWAHYANSHEGFVLEFDTSSSFFDQRRSPKDEFRHLRKVLYSDVRPSIVLMDMDDFSPFLTKGIEWSYEAEWRMMLALEDATSVAGECASAIHLFEFPRRDMRGVILGCRMTAEKKEEIRRILAETPEYQHCYCVEAQTDEQHYQLTIPPVAMPKSAGEA